MGQANDPRVTAIRSNPRVGEGSCTSIDECYGDSELVEERDRAGAKTPEAAVKWALESEGLWREQGLNASSGEVDCPLVASYNNWHAGD